MARIKRLTCFDAPKIKKMVSYLGDGEKFSRDITTEALMALHNCMPLRLKFLPESFILLDGDEILGLITVMPTVGNPQKVNITRLVFQQNYYDAGKQLVEYVMAKYGAKGATSFVVSVDVSHSELLDLFMSGCGFRQCSGESLWKIDNIDCAKEYVMPFRKCQNSDAKYVCRLFNGELINHFRPSLDRVKEEYHEPIFAGLTSFYKNRYVLEDSETNRLIAYISITTSDHSNFIIDISTNAGYSLPYEEILNFAYCEIAKRKSKFYAFVKVKKYIKTAESFENYLRDKGYDCVQTQFILVKDFYRPIKQTENTLQVFLFGESGITTH